MWEEKRYRAVSRQPQTNLLVLKSNTILQKNYTANVELDRSYSQTEVSRGHIRLDGIENENQKATSSCWQTKYGDTQPIGFRGKVFHRKPNMQQANALFVIGCAECSMKPYSRMKKWLFHRL